MPEANLITEDDKVILALIGWDAMLNSSEENEMALKWLALARAADGNAVDCIKAAFARGPLYDGDVPSKAGRDWCLEQGLIAKVIVRGEWGYNALTYKGAWVYKVLIAMGAEAPKKELS